MRLYSGEGHRKCLRPAFQLPLSLLKSGYQWKGGGILSLRGHLVIPGNTFGCYNLGDCAPGILWREARDATKPPPGPGAPPATKSCPVQKSAKVEKCHPSGTWGRCTWQKQGQKQNQSIRVKTHTGASPPEYYLDKRSNCTRWLSLESWIGPSAHAHLPQSPTLWTLRSVCSV